jgi:hypothetical protein
VTEITVNSKNAFNTFLNESVEDGVREQQKCRVKVIRAGLAQYNSSISAITLSSKKSGEAPGC